MPSNLIDDTRRQILDENKEDPNVFTSIGRTVNNMLGKDEDTTVSAVSPSGRIMQQLRLSSKSNTPTSSPRSPGKKKASNREWLEEAVASAPSADQQQSRSEEDTKSVESLEVDVDTKGMDDVLLNMSLQSPFKPLRASPRVQKKSTSDRTWLEEAVAAAPLPLEGKNEDVEIKSIESLDLDLDTEGMDTALVDMSPAQTSFKKRPTGKVTELLKQQGLPLDSN